MGGIGSGGHAASGEKGYTDIERFRAGTRNRQGKPPELKPLPPVEIPSDLSESQVEVWLDLAPHALKARTLTEGTKQAFRDLVEAIVVKNSMLAQIKTDGLTYEKITVDGTGKEQRDLKAHPLITHHRGWTQRVEAGMVRFRLSPIGKELNVIEEEIDPFAEFEGAAETQ